MVKVNAKVLGLEWVICVLLREQITVSFFDGKEMKKL